METPFIYNKYVTGKNFIGRRSDSTVLSNLLSAGENVSLYEPPKSGKMSLVEQTLFNMRIQGKHFLVAEVNLLDVRSCDVLLRRWGDAVIRCFATTPSEYSDIVKTHLEGTHFVFDEEVYSQKDEILSTNWEVDENDIKAILTLPYSLAEGGDSQLFVLVDEFQNIEFCPEGERIFKILESVFRETGDAGLNRSCSLILCGSRVNAMKEIFEHRKFFWRQVEHLPLQKVDEKEIIDHIIKGFLSSGKVIDRNLLFGVCKLFDNNLWYINHFTSICDSLSKGYIMEPVLLDALDMLMSIHEPRFIATMDDLTTFQVNLLRAVVEGHTKFSSSEVISRYGLNSSANVRRLKDALCKKEILTFDDKDEPQILDPLFKYWVMKKYFRMKVDL
jgi:uncharacterized protein